jgi:hypothetical protein
MHVAIPIQKEKGQPGWVSTVDGVSANPAAPWENNSTYVLFWQGRIAETLKAMKILLLLSAGKRAGVRAEGEGVGE